MDEELSSTDATLKKGGITRAPLLAEAANLLWRQAEVKGENVRLDWSREGALPPPSEMRPPNQDVADLSEALQHRVTQGYYFSGPRHINLQEASVVKTEIKALASEKIPARGMRRCFLNDSRVCVGSWGKGRSSSRRLNGIWRSCMGYMVAGRMSIGLIWISTHSNTADCPTRDNPLPPVRPAPTWLANIYSRSGAPTPYS